MVVACSATTRRALVEASRLGRVWPSAWVRATHQGGGSRLLVPTPTGGHRASFSARLEKRADGVLFAHVHAQASGEVSVAHRDAYARSWARRPIHASWASRIVPAAHAFDAAARPPPPPPAILAPVSSHPRRLEPAPCRAAFFSSGAAMEATEGRVGPPLATARAPRSAWARRSSSGRTRSRRPRESWPGREAGRWGWGLLPKPRAGCAGCRPTDHLHGCPAGRPRRQS